jgi:hypothetical protein
LDASPKSRASYTALEQATRGPWPRERKYFVEKYGPITEGDQVAAAVPGSDTYLLATALTGLTEELQALRNERVALWKGIAAALRSPAGGHVARALRDALEPLLPEGVQQ